MVLFAYKFQVSELYSKVPLRPAYCTELNFSLLEFYNIFSSVCEALRKDVSYFSCALVSDFLVLTEHALRT